MIRSIFVRVVGGERIKGDGKIVVLKYVMIMVDMVLFFMCL